MANRLLPCPGCDRHVRATDARCPFCDAALSPSPAVPRRAAPGLTRAAILFAGATAASACGPVTPSGDAAAEAASDVQNTSEIVALYGPAPVDAMGAEDAANQPDIVAMYGPAPVDAMGADAATDSQPPMRDGEPVVLYGPVPVDSGNQG